MGMVTCSTSLLCWMKCGFQSQSAVIGVQFWMSSAAGRRPVNVNLLLIYQRPLQVLRIIRRPVWWSPMTRSQMMNLPLVILPHDVTQDQREKLEMKFGIQITCLSNMSLGVNIFHQAPLMRPSLSLILLPSPKPRTFLQRKQLLQREQVLFEVVTLMVEAAV